MTRLRKSLCSGLVLALLLGMVVVAPSAASAPPPALTSPWGATTPEAAPRAKRQPPDAVSL